MWQSIKAYLQLARWSNLVMLAILIWVMQQWVAIPVLHHAMFTNVLPWWIQTLLILAAVLIAAGGYVINDYFDIKIDRINRPDKVIVTNTISKQQAIRYHQALSVTGATLGLIVAWWCRSWTLGLIYIIIPGLLWFYSSTYKRQFIVGNIIISLLAAMPPITIAMANIGGVNLTIKHILESTGLQNVDDWMDYSPVAHNLYIWLGVFALFAFLTTLMREIIKDLEDVEGDRELECHTLPVRMGEWGTKWVVSVLALITIALLIYIGFFCLPYPSGWNTLSGRYIIFGIITPLLGSLWLMWAAKIPSDYHVAQNVMKFVMLMGMLYSFVICRCL